MVNQASGEVFKHAANFLSSHSTAVQSVLTVAAVAGINQLIEVAAFECPCIMEADLNLTCESYLSSFCPLRDKATYSYLFVFGPASILLFLGFMLNKKFWRTITGCCCSSANNICCCIKKKKRYAPRADQGNPETSNAASPNEKKTAIWKKLKVCVYSVFSTLGFASIAPLSWILLSLIDGEYLACGLTSLPYSFGPEQTCQNTTNVSTADSYTRTITSNFVETRRPKPKY